jgi:iron complex outermembrane receptor protein
MFRNIHAIVVFTVLASLSAFAYGQDAQIQGQVLDTSGAGIPKALVRVVDQQTSTERKTETNETGQYTVLELASGIYKIVVEAPAFSSAVSDQITLNPGQSAVMDFTLKVSANSTDVVVTTEKREDTLQHVPVPVAVIEPDKLVENNQTLLRDYFSSVPSLDLAPDIFGSQVMDIRGITTGGPSNPTVGVLIDDVPFGATVGHAGGAFVPDFDPGDLERIEVLRGPQGTLYGADSLGGLINYITKDPSTDRFSGRFEGGIDGVHNGSQLGYSLRASVNVPLSSTVAVRANGFARQEPGYINNVFTGQNGVNKSDAYGGRLSALWRPSDSLSIKATGLYQYTRIDGINESNETSNLGQLQQNYIAGLPHKHSPQAYSLSMNYRFKNIHVTSLTGFNANILSGFYDYTPYFGPTTEKLYGVSGTPLQLLAHYKKATEEVRLTSSVGKIDWLAGFYYTIESNHSVESLFASDLTTGQIVGLQYTFVYPDSFDEYAGFFDLTYHFTDRLDIQLGGA